MFFRWIFPGYGTGKGQFSLPFLYNIVLSEQCITKACHEKIIENGMIMHLLQASLQEYIMS